MKKLLFVYNPNAGKGLLRPKVSDMRLQFILHRATAMHIKKYVNWKKNTSLLCAAVVMALLMKS